MDLDERAVRRRGHLHRCSGPVRVSGHDGGGAEEREAGVSAIHLAEVAVNAALAVDASGLDVTREHVTGSRLHRHHLSPSRPSGLLHRTGRCKLKAPSAVHARLDALRGEAPRIIPPLLAGIPGIGLACVTRLHGSVLRQVCGAGGPLRDFDSMAGLGLLRLGANVQPEALLRASGDANHGVQPVHEVARHIQCLLRTSRIDELNPRLCVKPEYLPNSVAEATHVDVHQACRQRNLAEVAHSHRRAPGPFRTSNPGGTGARHRQSPALCRAHPDLDFVDVSEQLQLDVVVPGGARPSQQRAAGERPRSLWHTELDRHLAPAEAPLRVGRSIHHLRPRAIHVDVPAGPALHVLSLDPAGEAVLLPRPNRHVSLHVLHPRRLCPFVHFTPRASGTAPSVSLLPRHAVARVHTPRLPRGRSIVALLEPEVR